MRGFFTFYYDCPACKAVLSGKQHDMLGVNCTELYSDGKMICDEYLSAPQLLVRCPSCSYLFWTKDPNHCSEEKMTTPVDKTSVYPYSSWYLFGANTTRSLGKFALIKQLEKAIATLRPLNADQELYLRKQLLWAFNDLVRITYKSGFWSFLKGELSFSAWRHVHRQRLREKLFYVWRSDTYKSNIKRIIELIRSSADKEVDKVYIAELYRLKGNFSRSIEILDELHRATHYANLIRERATKKNPAVFKVAG